MSKALRALACVLVVSASSVAAPQITGDQTVKPGGFALLRLTGADAAIWDVSPEPIQAEEVAGSFVFTASPGTYTVRAIIVNFEAKKIERVKFVVVFLGGPGPQPVPPVPPGPAPPTPISPFAKRLQDAATADGMARAKLADIADGVTRASAAFRTNVTADKVHADCVAALAKVPPLGRNLAAIIDEQVTATLANLLKTPGTELDADTAKRLREMFTALADALREAAR